MNSKSQDFDTNLPDPLDLGRIMVFLFLGIFTCLLMFIIKSFENEQHKHLQAERHRQQALRRVHLKNRSRTALNKHVKEEEGNERQKLTIRRKTPYPPKSENAEEDGEEEEEGTK